LLFHSILNCRAKMVIYFQYSGITTKPGHNKSIRIVFDDIKSSIISFELPIIAFYRVVDPI
jgi:hypothetical protein